MIGSSQPHNWRVKNTFTAASQLLGQTQPCRQTLSSCNSRQEMTCVALENTASISTDTTGSVGNSG